MKNQKTGLAKGFFFFVPVVFVISILTMFISHNQYTSACFPEKEMNRENLPVWDGVTVSQPVRNGYVSSDFNTVDSFHHVPHNGTDFASSGTVYAVVDGTVVARDYDESRGHYIAIAFKTASKKSYTYLYQHLASSSMKNVGDLVKTGEKVGIIGNTGHAFGIHLHAEVEYAKEEVDGKVKWRGTYPTNPNVMFDFVSFFHLPHLYVSEKNKEQKIERAHCQSSVDQLIGADNIEKAWNFFRQQGFTEEASAGVIGNLIVESNMEPTIKEIGAPLGGRGIAQWGTCGPSANGVSGGCRWLSFVKWAKKNNHNPDELLPQLHYIIKEMEDAEIVQYFKLTTILYIPNQGQYGGGAVGYFAEKFERPDVRFAKMDQRFIYAQKVLLKYGGGDM